MEYVIVTSQIKAKFGRNSVMIFEIRYNDISTFFK